jgi:hypothetical protein
MNRGAIITDSAARRAGHAWAALLGALVWVEASGAVHERAAVAQHAPSDEASWTWTPQPIAIAVETDGDPSLSEGLVRAVRETIERDIEAKFGAAWSTRFVEGVDAAATTALKGPQAEAGEKQIRILLARRGGAYVVEAREVDPHLRSIGPLVTRTVRQRAMTGEAAAAAAIAAFRPTARIDDIQGDRAVLRLRGESLLTAEVRAELLAGGEGFVPLLERRDREGRITSVERLPWTVISIRDAAARPAAVVISSGLRNPLAGRRRGRVATMAIAAGKPSGDTILSVTAGSDGEPLSGVHVYDAAAGGSAALLGTTDDRGRIEIGNDGAKLRTLILAGRYLPLARLPLIPGLDSEVSAPLPADARLLEAERRLANLQAEFTDRMVLRRVLAIAAAGQLERGDKAAATVTIRRLGELGGLTDLADALDARKRAMELGSSTADRLIDRLYTEAATAMRAVDDRQAIAELRKRLAEAK